MDLPSCCAINGPNVIHDTVAGETVVINLNSGAYYSLQHTGAEIWGLIEKGTTVEGVIQFMTKRYSSVEVDVARVVAQFLQKLQEENLIRVDGSSLSGPRPVGDTSPATGSSVQAPVFEMPVLQVYRDLENILLLDPIHEVDEEGWPVAKPPSSP